MDLFSVTLLGLIALKLLVIVIIFFLFVKRPTKISSAQLRGLHVFITGGSKGIGLALASEYVRRGCHVTIVARNESDLEKACRELRATRVDAGQKIQFFALDVVTRAYDSIVSVFEKADSAVGRPVDILVNNAGGSVQAAFDQLPLDAFESQMRLNYLSAVYLTRAWVERVKHLSSSNTAKRVVFMSSQAGLVGVFGYSAYCSAKFALRGFAETLQAELKPYGFAVTMVFPPNTDTDGFKEELKTMPRETELISSSSGLFKPDSVARCTVEAVCSGTFMCNIGLDGWMLGTLVAGMAPVASLWELMEQAWLMGLARLISLFVMNGFDKTIENCKLERDKAK